MKSEWRITLEDACDFLDWRRGHGDVVEIADISVGSVRRKGNGRRLVEKLFSLLEPDVRVYAITRAENKVAQEFYHALGFKVIAPLFDFYGVRTEHGDTTVDAIMYGRRVKGPI